MELCAVKDWRLKSLEIGSVALDFDSNLPRVLFDFDFGFALRMYDVLK